MAAQQGRDAGIMSAEIAVGVIAAGSDNRIRGLRRCVAYRNGNFGIELTKRLHDILHEHTILGRGLDPATVATRHDAQQIEKSHKGNISGHNDQDLGWAYYGKRRVGFQPLLQLIALQHLPIQRLYGTSDLFRGEPGILLRGPKNNFACRNIVTETLQTIAQCGKKLNRIFHEDKDNISARDSEQKISSVAAFPPSQSL